MAKHNILGKRGEDIACRFLQENGYEILERNWTWRRLELDIIARKGNCLIIAEIRTRSTDLYGEPEYTVSDKKIRRIINAADVYIKKNMIDLDVRFDIISITGHEGDFKIKHIEDASNISKMHLYLRYGKINILKDSQ